MIIVPLVGLVGGLVAVAYAVVREEQSLREYQERQDLAKEERQVEKDLMKETRQAERDAAKLAESREYTEWREEVGAVQKGEDKAEDRAYGEAREAAKEAHKEGHAEAVYLVPYYRQWVGQPLAWTLKALPKPVSMTLERVTSEGLKFEGIDGLVLFHHVESIAVPGEEEEDADDEQS